jgi:quercetin dioxygenase-like cupin family protein
MITGRRPARGSARRDASSGTLRVSVRSAYESGWRPARILNQDRADHKDQGSQRIKRRNGLKEDVIMIAEAAQTTTNIRFGPGGGIYRIVATPATTGGSHFAFEAYEPPGGGPPLHTHANEDEFFLVLEGAITFYVGGRVTTVGAGGTAFVPRGVAHCFKNTSDRDARLLVLFTPGAIEGFFEYGRSDSGVAPSDEALIAELARLGPQFGLELLGPSPL